MKRTSTRPRPGPVACFVYTRGAAPAPIRAALFREGFTVLERQFSRAVTDLLDDFEPDVVVVVVDSSDVDDLAVLRFLRAHLGSTPILALCSDQSAGEESCIAALEAGADVAFSASAGPNLVGAQARALSRRRAGVDAQPTSTRLVVRDLAIDFGRRTVARRGRPLELTRSEFDILAVLLRSAGRVLSPGEIVSAIGQVASSPAQARGMVKVHVSHLRQKLGANEDGEYVVTVRGVGYLFERAGDQLDQAGLDEDEFAAG